MKKLKLRPYLSLIPLNGVVTIGSSPNTSIEIEDNDGLIYDILVLCDGDNTSTHIYESLLNKYTYITEEYVQDIINQLKDLDYIFESEDSDTNNLNLLKHSRNINFLSNMDKHGDSKYNYLNNIQNSTVMIIGLGGAGTNFLYNLVTLGVKNIIGVDFDCIEDSNLNRQLFFEEQDIGSYKVEVISKKISKINSDINFIPINIKVTSKAQIENLLIKYKVDYLLCSADYPPFWIHKWCNDACIKTNTIWSYTGMMEYITKLQTIIPGKTSCYQCLETTILSNEITKEKYLKILKNKYTFENDCIFANSSFAASLLAFDFIKIIGKIPNADIMSINNIVIFDHIMNNLSFSKVPMDQNCLCKEGLNYDT